MAKTDPASNALDSEKLDRAADQLAAAVRSQWEKAAGERGLAGVDPIQVTWGRPSVPMTGPLAAAVGAHRFDPLPGLAPVGEAQLAAGQISGLHSVYGGLASGRLVIAGAPGSGKSGAAVLLIVAALRHRERVAVHDKPKTPVPVLVTAQDWDPRRQPVADWLTKQLRETYPLFSGATGAATAAALIAAGKIAVIIDGLDEIAADLRPVALQALSQQATFRIVVLSRTAEMASAASQAGVLRGAVAIELRTIDPAEAASYLARVQLDPPPNGWRDLIEHIRDNPASPLSKALDNPLTLTLVRDTYQSGDDVRELLEFCDIAAHGAPGEETITDHLLDRVLPAAYTQRPGQSPPPYDVATAHNALSKIAARMSRDGTRDLQWWNIPAWTPRNQHVMGLRLVLGLGLGLVLGPAVGLVLGLESSSPVAGLLTGFAGVVFGSALGLVAGFFTLGEKWRGKIGGKWLRSTSGNQPKSIGKLQLRKALKLENLLTGFVAGLGFDFAGGSIAGIVAGIAAVLVFGLVAALTADPDTSSPRSPASSWRDNQNYGLMVWLVFGLAFGLAAGLVAGLAGGGLVFGLAAALAMGLAGGLVFGLANSEFWRASLAAAQLTVKWRTPVRLMKFLDDAHNRNVLRTVGPAYQFRHARLQDRLAAGLSPSQIGQAATAITVQQETVQQENAATARPDSDLI